MTKRMELGGRKNPIQGETVSHIRKSDDNLNQTITKLLLKKLIEVFSITRH